MTKEQIREKADKFISTWASGMPKEMDYYVNILTEFATEVTKELEKENANLKALRKYELNVAKLEIEKLEQRNVKLIALINAERERQEKCDDVHLRKIAELEKENAELKKENTELKTRWQCRNKYMCNENGKGVPCYIYYGCLNCHHKIE